MEYPVDANKPWYHGSPLELEVLRAGSTVTQWKELARAFGAKPARLAYQDIGGPITHNGTEKGILYVIDEPVAVGVDMDQHPRTAMDKGAEFLTRRPLKLKRVK